MASEGIVVQVMGVVVDVEFSAGDLPSINNALEIRQEDNSGLIIEVQEHIDADSADHRHGEYYRTTPGLIRS